MSDRECKKDDHGSESDHPDGEQRESEKRRIDRCGSVNLAGEIESRWRERSGIDRI
jgi:hypothetical protein